MNDTATIRARIHESAIRRVTRTFAATLTDAFSEILQNARRAGATRVRVAVTGPADTGPLTVTVTDDGAGIADAGVLLSFGENGWNEDLVAAEDAAGMGMLSLARRGCTVSSRPRATNDEPAPGWRVDLLPEHFLGVAEAQVQPDDTAPYPCGTAVTFKTSESENADTVHKAIGTAAWHYPLPVVFENVPATPAGGEALERRAFLDGALHAERWRGLVFGVFKDRWAGFGLHDPDVNFHGLTVPVRLPSVEAVTGPRWSVAADIVNAPISSSCCPRARRPSRLRFSTRCARPPGSPSTARWPPIRTRARPTRTGSGRTRAISTSPRRRPSSGPGAPPSPTSTTGASRPPKASRRRNASPGAARGRASPPPSSCPAATTSTTTWSHSALPRSPRASRISFVPGPQSERRARAMTSTARGEGAWPASSI